MSLYCADLLGQVSNARNTNASNIGGAKMHDTNTVHLTAVSLTVGNDAAPPRLTPGRFRSMVASLVKGAKRGGADRVEIDTQSRRIIIPLTGAASEEPSANGNSDELDDWIAKHADKIKEPK
jgi:hypothetical protein